MQYLSYLFVTYDLHRNACTHTHKHLNISSKKGKILFCLLLYPSDWKSTWYRVSTQYVFVQWIKHSFIDKYISIILYVK